MAKEVFRKDLYCPESTPLKYDEACLIVENVLNITLVFVKLLDLCHECRQSFWVNIPPSTTLNLLVTIFAVTSFQYFDETGETFSCITSYPFEQHGVYKYIADFSCDYIHVITSPDYPYTSFLICTVITLAIWVLYLLLITLNVKEKILMMVPQKFLRKPPEEIEIKDISKTYSDVEVLRKVVYNEEMNTEYAVEYVSRGMNTVHSGEEYENLPPIVLKPLEFVEFDALLALRGLVVVLWVFLFVEKGTIPFFRESPWNGFKLYDIPIGWFYWVLAASFYLQIHHSLHKGITRARVLVYSVLLRGVLYIIGGFVYNNINNTSQLQQAFLTPFPPINNIRVFGIFQRIGLTHLLISSLEVSFMKRNVKRGPLFQDLLDSWPQWSIVLALVVVHIGFTSFLPLPFDCPTGYTGPGGYGNKYFANKCTGGAAAFIDSKIFPEKNLLPIQALQGRESIYNLLVPFDPQGLLGTLTTCFLMALAMQATRIFLYFNHPLSRVIRLSAWTVWQLLLGGLLCSFRKYDGLIPVNKYLMSVSYVLLVSGFAFLTLLCFYVVIDVWKIWSGYPLIYTGVNILVMFVGSYLFQHTFPFQWEIPVERKHTNNEFLLQAFWSVSFWIYVCYLLFKHRLVCPV